MAPEQAACKQEPVSVYKLSSPGKDARLAQLKHRESVSVINSHPCMTPRSPGLLPLSPPCQDTGWTRGQESGSHSRGLLLIPAPLTYHCLPSALASITSSHTPPAFQCSNTQSSHVHCHPHTNPAEILSPLSHPAAPRHQSPNVIFPDGEGSTLAKMWCSPRGSGCSEMSSDQQVPKLCAVCFYQNFHSSCNLSYTTQRKWSQELPVPGTQFPPAQDQGGSV